MLESELQRQKRERNFQQRVLNAVEAPKRNRFLAVINSAFFLWCISALFLTVGGGYLTNHQQCVREADQLIERRSLLTQELYGRQLAFSRIIEEATNWQKLPSGPSTAGSSVADFSKLSYFAVQQEFIKLLGRIEYAELPDTALRDAQRSWSDFNNQEADRLHDEVQRPLDDKPPKLDPSFELRSRKLQAQLFNDFAQFQHDLDSYAYYFQPDCTPLKTLGLAIGYKPRIVIASISPLLGDMKNIFSEAIERFIKLQADIRSLHPPRGSTK